jgi:hypothetical protein
MSSPAKKTLADAAGFSAVNVLRTERLRHGSFSVILKTSDAYCNDEG